MEKYLKIFKYLWNLKRIENLLSSSWKKNISNSNLNSSNFIRFKMLNFLKNLQFYFSFQVLDNFWNNFNLKLNEIFKNNYDLDLLIKIHEDYIENVFKSLMIEKSEIQILISKILNLIIQYLNFENSIFTSSSASASSIDSKIESNFNLIEKQFDILNDQLQNITKFKLSIDFR